MSEAALARECAVFTRYLTGLEPTPLVLQWYARAHALRPDLTPRGPLGRALVRAASLGGPAARCADAYARLTDPGGALRRKLVLLLAVLEVTPPYAARIDSVPGGGAIVTWARLAWIGTVWIAAALAGLIVFLPLRLILGRARAS